MDLQGESGRRLGIGKMLHIFFHEMSFSQVIEPFIAFFFFSSPLCPVLGRMACVCHKAGLDRLLPFFPQKPLYIRCNLWQIDPAGLKLHFEANLVLR